MASIRGVRGADGRFVILDNAALQDGRLSLRARGILALVLSYPEDWNITTQQISDMCQRDGRDAVRAAMRELESLGYCKRTRRSGESGRFSTSIVVTDVPSKIAEPGPGPENPVLVPPAETEETAGRTETGKPGPGLPGIISKTVLKTKENSSNPAEQTLFAASPTAAKASPATPNASNRDDYDSDPTFVAFWSAYPRKEAKRDAFKAWKAAIKKVGIDKIRSAYMADQAELLRREPQYRPLPAKWLRSEPWDNEAPTAPRLLAAASVVRAPHCGDIDCDEATRMKDTPTGVVRCPDCGTNTTQEHAA